jgi:hypothetical protein
VKGLNGVEKEVKVHTGVPPLEMKRGTTLATTVFYSPYNIQTFIGDRSIFGYIYK